LTKKLAFFVTGQKFPFFMEDPNNDPSIRNGNLKTDGATEDNFKYESLSDFNEKIVVPKFYQGNKKDRDFIPMRLAREIATT